MRVPLRTCVLRASALLAFATGVWLASAAPPGEPGPLPLLPSQAEPAPGALDPGDFAAAAARIDALLKESSDRSAAGLRAALAATPGGSGLHPAAEAAVAEAEIAARQGNTLRARRFYRDFLRSYRDAPDRFEAAASGERTDLRSANLEFLTYRVRQLDDQRFKMIVHKAFFVLLVGAVSAGIAAARRGRRFRIREIAGVNAIPDAVGRATEMGRPSLFSISLSDMEDPETFAAMPVLKYVAKLSARLKNRLIVPILGERTIPLISNAYREGCLAADNPDAFDPGNLRFFPGGQFFYAIASMGYMLRERPASCFYFGRWEAESLMFGETGQVVQALQIAATPHLFQIPFFIAACDYVIIGEEFYAASALLGENPNLRGSLAGQDVVKLVILAVILIGTLFATFGAEPVRAWIVSLIEVLGT